MVCKMDSFLAACVETVELTQLSLLENCFFFFFLEATIHLCHCVPFMSAQCSVCTCLFFQVGMCACVCVFSAYQEVLVCCSDSVQQQRDNRIL